MKGLVDVIEVALLEPLTRFTDPMTESGNPLVSRAGFLLYAAADRPVELLNQIEERLPFWLFVTKDGWRQSNQNAYELGRDAERAKYEPPARLAPVRHLHAVKA